MLDWWTRRSLWRLAIRNWSWFSLRTRPRSVRPKTSMSDGAGLGPAAEAAWSSHGRADPVGAVMRRLTQGGWQEDEWPVGFLPEHEGAKHRSVPGEESQHGFVVEPWRRGVTVVACARHGDELLREQTALELLGDHMEHPRAALAGEEQHRTPDARHVLAGQRGEVRGRVGQQLEPQLERQPEHPPARSLRDAVEAARGAAHPVEEAAQPAHRVPARERRACRGEDGRVERTADGVALRSSCEPGKDGRIFEHQRAHQLRTP